MKDVCASVSGIDDAHCRCLSPLFVIAVKFDGKMSENSVFYLETKSIVDTAVKTAVAIGDSEEEHGGLERSMRRKVSERFIFITVVI